MSKSSDKAYPVKSVPERIVDSIFSQVRIDFLVALAQGGVPVSETTLQRSLIDGANAQLQKVPLKLTELNCHSNGIVMGMQANAPGVKAIYQVNLVVSSFVLNRHRQVVRLKISKTEVAIDNNVSKIIGQMLQTMMENFLHTTLTATPLSNYLEFINPLEAEINLKRIPGWRKLTTLKMLNTSIFAFFPFKDAKHLQKGLLLKADLEHWKFRNILENVKKGPTLK